MALMTAMDTACLKRAATAITARPCPLFEMPNPGRIAQLAFAKDRLLGCGPDLGIVHEGTAHPVTKRRK